VQLTEIIRQRQGERSTADFVIFCQKNVDFQRFSAQKWRFSARFITPLKLTETTGDDLVAKEETGPESPES
jgi:hypothetical protein